MIAMNTTQTHGVRRAAELLGSQVALARALQVTPVTVYQWLNPDAGNGRQVPPKQCVRIEQLTEGRVTRKDLRPDDWLEFWPELAKSNAERSSNAIEFAAIQGLTHG